MINKLAILFFKNLIEVSSSTETEKMANAPRKKHYLKLTTWVEKLKILVRSVLTWTLFAFFDNLKIFVQLQHIRNIILSALEWQFFEILFFIPWQMKLKSWLIFQTNFSNFFYNKVYSFTFLGILDKGDFYFLTPFMKIAFFLGREYAL